MFHALKERDTARSVHLTDYFGLVWDRQVLTSLGLRIRFICLVKCSTPGMGKTGRGRDSPTGSVLLLLPLLGIWKVRLARLNHPEMDPYLADLRMCPGSIDCNLGL